MHKPHTRGLHIHTFT